MTISPDGSTLYWKESLRQSTPTESGEVLIRGYSLPGGATQVLFGGGEGRCAITTSEAGIAAMGGQLVVLDYGPPEGGSEPPYGDKVLTFGPDGSGCPVPIARFSVDGKDEEGVTVEKGKEVTFDASKSELLNGFRRELVWKFGDGTEKVVPCSEEEGECKEEAPATITHKYAMSGNFIVRLEIKLSEAPFGSPPPAERTLSVQGSKPKFKLTASHTGPGEGTVTSSPGGIACGSSCEAEYEEGTAVTLSPAPAEHSEFKGWSGACTGTGACEVTMSQARSVSAEFVPKPKLTVSDTGPGEGTVTSSPGGINCGATCEAQYSDGTVVTLTAIPAEHSEFHGWSGACTGAGTCEVTMSQARSVSAEFASKPKFKLTVSDTGPGEGTVTSSPAGINCGGTCEAEYEKGTVVTLVPAAGEHSEFHGWSGACTGTGTCEVTMSEAKSVSAEFARTAKPKFKLTASHTGPGEGTVTSSPGGIACGSSCEAEYEEGTAVTLSPAPAEHSEFKGWSGACTGTGACEVTMSQARSVSAEFVPKPKLTVSDTGPGEGTVTSSPGGINCGATCEAQYSDGTVVTLTAIPAEHSEFHGWSGACTGAGTCEVTMSQARSVSAEFASKPKFKLTVSDTGPGEGTVTSSPAGINCGGTCEAEYEKGTVVTLVPAAGEHSEFHGWSGACTGTGTCEVTMSEAKSVSAEFVPVSTPRFKLEVSETGSGLVTSIPGGIACGAICERGYEKDTVVTLIPIPGVASEFKGWGGACAGTGACEVTMSEAREVTASFGNVLTVPPIEPVGGGGPSPGSEPTGEELPHHHHPKPKAPSLARCKKLKGKKKAKCIRHAHKRGR